MTRTADLGDTDEALKLGLLQRLIARDTPLRTHMNKFLGEFKSVNGGYEIVMDTEKRRRFGGIRNLLLELEFLERDFDKPRYWVCPQYLAQFIETKSVFVTTPIELRAILRAREKLGRDAELAVIKFEQHRLRHCRYLADRIKHVAGENVSIGYDILSFTETTKRRFDDRLIEVKAVSPIDWRFYWSRNEVESARIHGPNYFLYLVPVSKGGFDIRSVRIIQNPFRRVYENIDSWVRQEEVASFWPAEAILRQRQ